MGRIFKFDKDVDTDQIIASQYLLFPTIDEMKSHTFESLDSDFASAVKPGDFVVADDNFGCGSSREQAPSVLKALGVNLSIDDFGTGYATYRYLQAFPVDFIKIDKSFVQMASVDEISGHIVDNIVELARKPGLSIVAEGVETQEQADLMIGKGVHFLQGYLYSPPVPGNKFISEWVMKAGG